LAFVRTIEAVVAPLLQLKVTPYTNTDLSTMRLLAPVVDTVAVVASAVGGSTASFPQRISTGAAIVPAEVNVIAEAWVSAWA